MSAYLIVDTIKTNEQSDNSLAFFNNTQNT
jgi:hypothetical protein